ncbi:MAG: hypothetical protein H6Q38_2594, partial [Chloroflexi bacterium]|nr:hypothetical protein [Chloroflexota bacterium]
MTSQKYQVPYSKSTLEFSIPSSMQATLAVSRPTRPVENVKSAILDALAHPIGSKPLRELLKSGDRVCIVFTDITRSSPDHLLVPAILNELELAGVRDEEITLLCGTGMHRPSTRAEKEAKLGISVVERFHVIDNEPQNPAALVDLGRTATGVPVQLHRAAVEADLL